MRNIQVFDIIKGGFSKSESNVENYLVCPVEKVSTDEPDERSERAILKNPPSKVKWPKICVNDYLADTELKTLNEIKSKKEIKKFIDDRVKKSCKEPARTIFIELIFTTIKFSRRYGFNMKQTGAVLSQFYLTHLIFTSSYNISAEKLYLYFREIMLCHSVASPPDSLKIFSMDESENIMNFFYRTYLRNLPLIRTMCLPNFAFHLDYYLEPEVLVTRKPTIEKNEKSKKKKKK